MFDHEGKGDATGKQGVGDAAGTQVVTHPLGVRYHLRTTGAFCSSVWLLHGGCSVRPASTLEPLAVQRGRRQVAAGQRSIRGQHAGRAVWVLWDGEERRGVGLWTQVQGGGADGAAPQRSAGSPPATPATGKEALPDPGGVTAHLWGTMPRKAFRGARSLSDKKT